MHMLDVKEYAHVKRHTLGLRRDNLSSLSF